MPGVFWYGGYGAIKESLFQLAAGTALSIVVGQKGGDSTELKPGTTNKEATAGTGGGGGSFVYRSSDNFLYLAAGGGGGASYGYTGQPGFSGTTGTASVGATASCRRAGGENGNPWEG